MKKFFLVLSVISLACIPTSGSAQTRTVKTSPSVYSEVKGSGFPDISRCAESGDLLRWMTCACTEALDQATLICEQAHNIEACRAATERALNVCWILFPNKDIPTVDQASGSYQPSAN